jgi:dihydrodipicolinate synthase/N-acetylneuraminate lyase
MTAAISGILAPVTTPFDRQAGLLAEDAVRGTVAALLADGLSGIGCPARPGKRR